MKRASARARGIIAAAVLVFCITVSGCGTSQTVPEIGENSNSIYPEEYLKPVENGGTVVPLKYTAHDYFKNGGEYEKTAYVYLPAGYDEKDKKKKYNVLYLMHGGGVTEELFFIWGAEEGGTETKRLLDNMMANGDMEPCIVCTPTYNMEGAADEIESSLNFYREFTEDLIPAVEGEYHTYAKTVDAEGIKASRDHRAFGGFSMGAASTWAVFANTMDAVRYYLPMCGDSWIVQLGGGAIAPAKTAEALKKAVEEAGFTGNDFRIFWGTGTDDLAYPNIMPMLDALKKIGEPFRYCENYADGNLYCCVLEGGGHDFPTVHTAMYHGLSKFFR